MTAPAPRVIVVGAVNVDLVIAATRLPGPGETVVGDGPDRHGGGKGANAAVAAARAGARVSLIGAVGADDNGAGALAELREQGVDVSGVRVMEDRPTGVALIVVDARGENQIAVGVGANGSVGADHVRRTLARQLPGAGCVLVSTEIPGEAVAAAVEASTAAGVRCVLNPAPVIPAVAGLLSRGPLLTPNATELHDLAVLVGSDRLEGAEAARAIAARTGTPIVVTLGADGAMAVTPAGEVDVAPPRRTAVRDTTGAGDTYNGVLAVRLAAGDALGTAMRAATVAASLSVAHAGARRGMPNAAAIDAALRAA